MTFDPPGRPQDPAVVAEFERRRGVRLPRALVALFLAHDGGYLDDLSVPFQNHGRREGWNATDLQMASFTVSNGDGTMDWLADRAAEACPGILPFARDLGGWVHALDLRGPGRAAVVLLPGLAPCELPLPEGIIPVAPDFDAFLARLVRDGGTPAAVEPGPYRSEAWYRLRRNYAA